jgi:hypothetical protein
MSTITAFSSSGSFAACGRVACQSMSSSMIRSPASPVIAFFFTSDFAVPIFFFFTGAAA